LGQVAIEEAFTLSQDTHVAPSWALRDATGQLSLLLPPTDPTSARHGAWAIWRYHVLLEPTARDDADSARDDAIGARDDAPPAAPTLYVWSRRPLARSMQVLTTAPPPLSSPQVRVVPPTSRPQHASAHHGAPPSPPHRHVWSRLLSRRPWSPLARPLSAIALPDGVTSPNLDEIASSGAVLSVQQALATALPPNLGARDHSAAPGAVLSVRGRLHELTIRHEAGEIARDRAATVDGAHNGAHTPGGARRGGKRTLTLALRDMNNAASQLDVYVQAAAHIRLPAELLLGCEVGLMADD
jgi:hypothetical protein